MSVSYFNTNEYELMNKDNIVATCLLYTSDAADEL